MSSGNQQLLIGGGGVGALDGSTEAKAATSPASLRDQGITTNGNYWIRATASGQTAARLMRVEFNKVDSRDWVRVFLHTNRGAATENHIGFTIPWKGYLIQRPNNTLDYSYFSTFQVGNERGDTSTTTGGNKAGFRVFLGAAGGMGFYNTLQNPCSWGNSTGAVGAGFDGTTCGSWPDGLIMGTGTGSANYSEIGGTWSHWFWMDTAT